MKQKNLIIFDFMRTLYDPETGALVPGAVVLLQQLQNAGHLLYLVSKREGQRLGMISRLGLRTYFNEVFLTENKQVVFKSIRAQHPHARIWAVGDRARGEIRYGNEIGAVTIWFKQGAFASEEPLTAAEKPDFTVTDLKEVGTHIS